MGFPVVLIVALQLFGAAAVQQEPAATSAISSSSSPIRKVVTLIQEMKVQVEKEADQDQEAYDKYKCWCVTNEKEKSAAIKSAETSIEELTAFVEEAAAKEGQLKTEIAQLEADIEDDKNALASAAGIRDKENKQFLAEEADTKETIDLLSQALDTLSKVQLLQKSGAKDAAAQETTALLELRHIVQRRFPTFQNVMQKDLFDMLGSLQDPSQQQPKGAFLAQATRLLPWETTDEQKGAAANPNAQEGAAAGAKSYNSRSGGIVGLLSSMRDQMGRDLMASQKQEFEALKAFQQLRAAKLAEIAAANKQREEKEALLSDTMAKAAEAKEEIESLNVAMAADQEFLGNLVQDCKVVDEEYAGRVKVRTEEIRALAETLKILTADESRDLFGKTISFLQVDTDSSAAMDRASDRAMQRIIKVAQRHHNWVLASLAVSVRLDTFGKVKVAMDKMSAELKKQQAEEYEKWEYCKTSIDETEDKIKEGEETKKDLDEKHLDLSNTIATLSETISNLKTEVADMEVSLKQAGEQRKEENQLFQSSVADQRATVNILNKALARLKEFYTPSAALVQRSRQVPGAAAPPPPPKPQAYEKSASSGGVLQLLAKVISEAEVAEQQLAQDEQKSQEDYAGLVKDTTASINADRDATANNEKMVEHAKGEKSETQESTLANDEELATQNDLLRAHHAECDFLLKYFDMRQKARAEEMDSIEDAKAILSGANFGL